MFGALMKYKSIDFYNAHKIVDLTTRHEHRRYIIMAVFLTAVDTGKESEFPFYRFTDAADQKEFDHFVYQCKKRSLYDTGVTAVYGDQLLTLSTCEYSQKNGRLAPAVVYIPRDNMTGRIHDARDITLQVLDVHIFCGVRTVREPGDLARRVVDEDHTAAGTTVFLSKQLSAFPGIVLWANLLA